MWIDRRVLMMGGAVSLLLNVFLIGIVVGPLIGLRRPPQAPASGPLVRPKALSPEDRRLFMAGMAPHRPSLKEARAAHRAARLAVEEDITSTPYDRDKVTSDFEALRKTNRDVDEALDSALIDALGRLSPEARLTIIHGHKAAPPRQ